MYLVVILIISILLIIVLSSKMQIHPLLALVFACLFFGIFSGMPGETIAKSINDGFGQTLGKIGMIIVLGVIIGKFLEKSGGAFAMAEKIIQLMGKKNVTAAMAFIGYIVAIPVFADSGFIILTPLNRSLTKRAGLSFATTSIALALGLITTHCMVPPTPGPLAAAGILNANLGLVLLVGMPVAFVSMLAGLFYSVKFTSDTYVDPAPELKEEDIQTLMKTAPGWLKSSLPIFVPILLIVVKSFLEFFGIDLSQSIAGQFIKFIGDPVMALIIGLFLALLAPEEAFERSFVQHRVGGRIIAGCCYHHFDYRCRRFFRNDPSKLRYSTNVKLDPFAMANRVMVAIYTYRCYQNCSRLIHGCYYYHCFYPIANDGRPGI